MADNLKNHIMILDQKGFKRIVDLCREEVINLPTGRISCDQVKRIISGSSFEFNGRNYYVFECDIYNYIMYRLKRHSQIIYPKEAGYILIRLNIAPGSFVGEAGTGSAALTSIFSRAVGRDGRVYTYEKRKHFIKRINTNLKCCQQYDNVVVYNRSIEEGIEQTGLDAFFLDLKNPWDVLPAVKKALKPGGHLGILVPTANQVSKTLAALETNSFYIMEVCEIMLRNYKLNPSRLRPEDRMVSHTGYLIFARSLENIESIE